jgi:hypothetical protein
MDEEVNILRESKGGSILKVDKTDGFSGQVNGGDTSSDEANQKFSDWNDHSNSRRPEEPSPSMPCLGREIDKNPPVWLLPRPDPINHHNGQKKRRTLST